MTNDRPIRFRTYADEDDTAWRGRDDRQAPSLAEDSAFEPEDPYLGATLPQAEPRPARGGAFLAWGTGLALVAGVAIAVTLLPKPGAGIIDSQTSKPSLRVRRYVAPEPGRLASSAMLPCYVNGASVGSLTVTDCGQRNGVASGSLDVGLNSAPTASTPSAAVAPIAPAAIARTIGPAPATPEQIADLRSARPALPSYAIADLPRRSFDVARPSRADVTSSSAPRAYADDDHDSADDRPIDPEESVKAARTFYEGLANADGARASSVVVPEKRRQGPLSADAIDRFYSGLQAPLRLTRLYPVNDHTVVARYAFVNRDGEVCQGAARVTTTERDGEVYVQGIRALNGC